MIEEETNSIYSWEIGARWPSQAKLWPRCTIMDVETVMKDGGEKCEMTCSEQRGKGSASSHGEWEEQIGSVIDFVLGVLNAGCGKVKCSVYTLSIGLAHEASLACSCRFLKTFFKNNFYLYFFTAWPIAVETFFGKHFGRSIVV